MSMTLQNKQQQSFVRLQQKQDNEGIENFLQSVADGFRVLVEENKKQGKQIESLAREIAKLHLGGLQAPSRSILPPAAEVSCRTAHDGESVCQRLERIQREIAALVTEITHRPEEKTQPVWNVDVPCCGNGGSQLPAMHDSQPAAGLAAREILRRGAQARAVPDEEPAADSVYTFANVFYRLTDSLFNSDRKRFYFSGNLEHVPLLPVLALIFFQQYLLPAFERVAMSLG